MKYQLSLIATSAGVVSAYPNMLKGRWGGGGGGGLGGGIGFPGLGGGAGAWDGVNGGSGCGDTPWGAGPDPRMANPWQGPGAGDVRGPCPGLNTLANHGFINRNGQGITVEMAVAGFKNGFNMGADIITTTAGSALGVCQQVTGAPCAAFNLDQLNTPHAFEHDASFTRQDYNNGAGDNHDFNQDIYNQVLNVWADTDVIDFSHANAARLYRIQDCKNNDQPGWFQESDNTQLTEIAFFLGTMGDPTAGNARKDWLSFWWQNERMPWDLGWFPCQRAEHNQGTISAMIGSIVNAQPPPGFQLPAPPAPPAPPPAASTPAPPPPPPPPAATTPAPPPPPPPAATTPAPPPPPPPATTAPPPPPPPTTAAPPAPPATTPVAPPPAPPTTSSVWTSSALPTTSLGWGASSSSSINSTTAAPPSTAYGWAASSSSSSVNSTTAAPPSTAYGWAASSSSSSEVVYSSQAAYSSAWSSAYSSSWSSAWSYSYSSAWSSAYSSAWSSAAVSYSTPTSSAYAAPPYSSAAVTTVSLSTSIAYVTTEVTVTSCAASVTDCPADQATHVSVVTSLVEDYTTVCPVTETAVPVAPASYSSSSAYYSSAASVVSYTPYTAAAISYSVISGMVMPQNAPSTTAAPEATVSLATGINVVTTTAKPLAANPYFTSLPAESWPAVPSSIAQQYTAAQGVYKPNSPPPATPTTQVFAAPATTGGVYAAPTAPAYSAPVAANAGYAAPSTAGIVAATSPVSPPIQTGAAGKVVRGSGLGALAGAFVVAMVM